MTLQDSFKRIIEIQQKLGVQSISVARIKHGDYTQEQLNLISERERLESKELNLSFPEMVQACANYEGVTIDKMDTKVEIPTSFFGGIGYVSPKKTNPTEMEVFRAEHLLYTIKGPTEIIKSYRSIKLLARTIQADGKTFLEHIVFKTVKHQDELGLYQPFFYIDDCSMLKIPIHIATCIDFKGRQVCFRSNYHKAILHFAIEKENNSLIEAIKDENER